ncbi:MAG TPA: Flp family type IVb pilin [Acidimicrobiia bacterium]|jgi:Flp pilus assembly pilin Flp
MAAKERSERGAALVEYAMIVSFIAVVSLSTVGMVGTSISGDIAAVGSALSDGADLGGDDDGQGQESGDDAESGDNDNNGNNGNQGNGGDNGNDNNNGVDDDFGDDTGDDGDDGDDGSGGDTGDDGGSGGDTGGDDAEEIEEDPSSSVDVAASAGSFYWWAPTPSGGDGAWKASVTFQNDWIRHQYLTVEVTRTASNGDTTTETVEVYVAAGSTGTYAAWNNNYSVRGNSEHGVVSVTMRVTSIRTYNESWQTQTHSTTGPTVEVTVPDVG